MSNVDRIMPMLAATIKEDRLEEGLPYLAQPKIDGIRAINLSSVATSRSLKPLPNLFIQEYFDGLPSWADGLDGELVTRDDQGEAQDFNSIQSAVMSVAGEPNFAYYVFDVCNSPNLMAYARYQRVKTLVRHLHDAGYGRIKLVPSYKVLDVGMFHQLEEKFLSEGHEGIVLRQTSSGYKYGRSTMLQGHLLRRKVWEDMEGSITGFEEMLHNGNVATESERGMTVRSSHIAGKVPAGTLGKFYCRCKFKGEMVNVKVGSGIGLDFELRQKVWDNREDYLGRLIKFKFTPIGSKNKPRHPIFLGFRNPIDMSPETDDD